MKFEIFTPIVIHELGQRDNQEDSVFPPLGAASDSDRLFLVCDGMGGHAKGEVASANVVDAMTSWIKQRTPENGVVTDDIIKNALQYAHQQLDKLDDGSENKMGTTLTLVCFHKGGVTMGHVGDSRIYHVRPSERKILYKSIDHSLVYELYRSGVISYDEMATSPQRNVITRAIMPGEENNDDIDLVHTTNVQPGDYFYLCSDGMLEEMTDDQLLNVLCAEASDVMKASSLVSMTAENKDNHTALLIKVKSVLAEDGDGNLLNDEAVSAFNEMAVADTVVVNENKPKPVVPPYKPEKKSQVQAQVKPKASTSEQNASAPVAAPVATQKKGVNKVLLLLVLLLLSLVVAGAVYIFMNKGNDDKAESEEYDEIKIENRDKNIDNDKDNDADDRADDFYKKDRNDNAQQDKQKKADKQKTDTNKKVEPRKDERNAEQNKNTEDKNTEDKNTEDKNKENNKGGVSNEIRNGGSSNTDGNSTD